MDRNRILVVEDVVSNIDVLLDALGDQYDVSVAIDGESALRTIEEVKPDIILLDIVMPGMDGYTICTKIKNNPETKEIPVIFLTALADEDDESRGLKLGAIDYIMKPYRPDIVRVRVANHLALRTVRKQLQQQNDHLGELVAERTRELAAANERFKAVDRARKSFLGVIEHELRTPANGILGIGQLALDCITDPVERAELSEIFEESSDRLLETIDNALNLGRFQSGETNVVVNDVDVASLIRVAIASVQPDAQEKNIDMIFQEHLADHIILRSDRNLLLQALTTFLRMNVLLTPCGSTVEIKGEKTEKEEAVILMIAHGVVLPDAHYESFFDEGSSVRNASPAEKMGLAIPLAAHIVRALDGEVVLSPYAGDGLLLRCAFRGECCESSLPQQNDC